MNHNQIKKEKLIGKFWILYAGLLCNTPEGNGNSVCFKEEPGMWSSNVLSNGISSFIKVKTFTCLQVTYKVGNHTLNSIVTNWKTLVKNQFIFKWLWFKSFNWACNYGRRQGIWVYRGGKMTRCCVASHKKKFAASPEKVGGGGVVGGEGLRHIFLFDLKRGCG